MVRLSKLITGGQSGVDRAALDVALELGIPYGGWCPAGGWAEDLTEPPGLLALYPNLVPTPSADPAERTRWNVRDSDAALVLVASAADVSPGTNVGVRESDALAKPQLVVDMSRPGAHEQVISYLERFNGIVLSVGGPRESEVPGIYELVTAFLTAVLAPTQR